VLSFITDLCVKINSHHVYSEWQHLREVLTAKDHIIADTYWITLRVLNACQTYPLLYNCPENTSQKCPLHWGDPGPPLNTWFPSPHAKWFNSAVFVSFTVVTNRETDRLHYICSNRPHLCTTHMQCGPATVVTLLHITSCSAWNINLVSARHWNHCGWNWKQASTNQQTAPADPHNSLVHTVHPFSQPLRYLPSGLLILQHNNNYCNTFCQYFFCTSSYVMTPFCHILNKHFKVTMFLLLTKSSEWWQEHWHPVIFYKIFTCKNARNLIITANFGFCIWRQENIARLCIAISFFPVLQ